MNLPRPSLPTEDAVRVPRYVARATWYKGNTHIHSVASDGGLTFDELAARYAEEGYDFLFRTDHWVMSDVVADAGAYPLLWLDGIELDGRDDRGSAYHVVCLGHFEDLDREMGLAAAVRSAHQQGGLIILAHPAWMGNSFDEALRWGFHGVEVYNNVCHWLNGKGNGLAYWQAMLARAPGTLAFASDDTHLRAGNPAWNGGWIMVQAEALTRDAVMTALRLGRFYSTTGPSFDSITYDGHRVTAQTSSIRFARLAGPASLGLRVATAGDAPMTEVSFDVPANWAYAYLNIEDERGRQAWTNTLARSEVP